MTIHNFQVMSDLDCGGTSQMPVTLPDVHAQ
jgi:hypothetical protein